ncbi:MAG TPA: tRNA (adenosine(37)-N6)-dimethylallyltransferase MiaA [Verrucomicrobiae bacterium]|nr:tRNA (adenosine(37)-N6)-dimethylallyltransferase MiaA [Verrucomicrobiae bacterium]
MKRREPLYICGPTAVGKSAVAIEIAKRLGGGIISVDSMQVYRGMDIGTAKPTAEERDKVQHHLIDVAEVTENFDAAKFVQLAKAAEEQIEFPIYCGGTGLYFNALLHGLGEAPASDPDVRRELQKMELEQLVEELRVKDLKCFERIDKSNPRRLVRALEVIRITGKPFSEQRAEWKETKARIVGLEMDRETLHRRIDRRVDEMFKRGLVDETRELLKRGLRENRTASQALGYKQVIEHLDGAAGLDETIELVKMRTRQFAKRQLTWFKRQLPVRWMNASENVVDELIDIHKLV